MGFPNGQRSNFYVKLKGVLIFRRGIIYPNSHTDFENSDKLSARPHLDSKRMVVSIDGIVSINL